MSAIVSNREERQSQSLWSPFPPPVYYIPAASASATWPVADRLAWMPEEMRLSAEDLEVAPIRSALHNMIKLSGFFRMEMVY